MAVIDRRQCIGLLAATAVISARGAQRHTRVIALLFDSLVSPFWLTAIERMRRYAAARGWSTLEAVSNLDDDRQYQQVQSMIQRGVDGIIIVQTDDKAVIPAIRAANAAGIPMIHFNRRPAASDAYSVAVVADNRKLMDETVTALVDIARSRGGHYKAAFLVGDLGDANAVQRRDGFSDAIARHPNLVQVVDQIATEWNADKAFAGLSTALEAHPDLNMLVTSSDFLTPQIEQALRMAGKWHRAGEPEHVLIGGFDGDENGYAQLAAGYYDVDGVQDLDYEVRLTFQALEGMWAGKRLPKLLIDPGFVITRDTLAQWRDRMWGYKVWRAEAARRTKGGAPLSISPGAAHVEENSVVSTLVPTGTSAASGATTWAVLVAGLTAFLAAMLSARTAIDVLLAMLPLAILAGGQLLVLLIGQIDLSMTAVMALGSITSAAVMTRHALGLSGPLAMLAGVGTSLAIGGAVGLFNGFCNAVLRIPSFIVTLAVMIAGSGLAVWYGSTVSETISIGGLPEAFRAIGYGTALGIPIALVLSATTLGIMHYVLSRTVAGRWLYAVGHNAVAARISGVPVQRVTVVAFTASGFCAGLATIIYTSRIETGLPTLGQNMLLDIVGATVIGGVSLFGGRGNVWMMLAGVAFLCVLDKGLQLLGLSQFLVLAIKGVAILVAVVIQVARRGSVTA